MTTKGMFLKLHHRVDAEKLTELNQTVTGLIHSSGIDPLTAAYGGLVLLCDAITGLVPDQAAQEEMLTFLFAEGADIMQQMRTEELVTKN